MFTDFRNSLEKIKTRQKLIDSHWDKPAEDDLLSFFIRDSASKSNADRCSIFIHDSKKQTLWIHQGTHAESREIEVPKEGSMVGKVLASGKPLIEDNLKDKEGAHKAIEHDTGFVTHNALSVPILSLDGTEVMGVIQILNKKDGESFDEKDLKLVEEIAHFMAPSIEGVYLSQDTLDITERVFYIARNIWFALLGTGVIIMLLLFTYIIGWIVIA